MPTLVALSYPPAPASKHCCVMAVTPASGHARRVLGARRGRGSPRIIQLPPQLGCHTANQNASKLRSTRSAIAGHGDQSPAGAEICGAQGVLPASVTEHDRRTDLPRERHAPGMFVAARVSVIEP